MSLHLSALFPRSLFLYFFTFLLSAEFAIRVSRSRIWIRSAFRYSYLAGILDTFKPVYIPWFSGVLWIRLRFYSVLLVHITVLWIRFRCLLFDVAFFSFYIYFSLYIFFIYFLCLPFGFLSRGKHKCHVCQGETHYFRKEWTNETKKITKEIQEKNVRFCGIALF